MTLSDNSARQTMLFQPSLEDGIALPPGSDMSLGKETAEYNGFNTTGQMLQPMQATTTDSEFVEFSMRGKPSENVHPLAHQNMIVAPSGVDIQRPAANINHDSELTMV